MAGLVLPKVECVESNESYGRFVAEPVEKGFGVTLGNAMRRVLLSSLPGAAVVSVQIEGIQHEFSTIPHAKEDTLDFLLNLKAIRIRPLAQRSGKLTMDIKGPRDVTAGDIKTTADFEVINKDLHLISLDSSKAKLNVELNVELGRGYVPAGPSDGLVIGVIPIDAVFTPVRKVNYTIEPSTSEEYTGKEKIVLEIWTDGTITPTEAVSQSAAVIIDQFTCFRELAKALVEEGEEPSWQRLLPPEQYDMAVDQLGLSTHTYNSLRRGGVTTLGQLLEKTNEGLSSLAGFGAKSQEEVETALKGLKLPVDIPDIKKITRKTKQSKASEEEEKENAGKKSKRSKASAGEDKEDA